MTGLRARLLTLTLTGLPVLVAAPIALSPAPASAADSAIDAFKAKHEAVVKQVKAGASDAEIQAKVDGLLDYDWLATAALGGPKNYAKVCGERCGEFEDLLTRLIRENYLRMIRKAEKHPVEYLGQVEGRNGIYKVSTRIKVEKNGREQTVTVDYVMHQTSDGWKVRDIITDDVSLARTYSYEFNKIAKKEGIEGIISKLQGKLAKLEAKG